VTIRLFDGHETMARSGRAAEIRNSSELV